jgi:hypothetical protein
LSKKAAQGLTTGDIQCDRDGEHGAVADLSLEYRKARVREYGDRAEHHQPCTVGTYSARYVT